MVIFFNFTQDITVKREWVFCVYSYYIYRKSLDIMTCSFRIITLLLLLTPAVFANSNNRLVSEKGILDLRELEFDRNTVVNLNGEWEFY